MRLNRQMVEGLSDELADLLLRLDQVHPSELPPSVIDRVEKWSAAGYKVSDGRPRLIMSDQINQRLSDNDESRRLREMLRNIEDRHNIRQVRIATSIGKDSLSVIVTCPNGEDEVDVAKEFANMTWGLREMVTHAFLEVARDQRPDIFDELLKAASLEVVELCNSLKAESSK